MAKEDMLNDDEIIVFLATANPQRSKLFYEETLGLEFLSEEPFALVFKVNGKMLRIFKVKELQPAPHTVLGWAIEDIESKIDELCAKGVEFQRFDGFEQDDRGIWVSPSGARIAWFHDPEGNSLSLTQF